MRALLFTAALLLPPLTWGSSACDLSGMKVIHSIAALPQGLASLLAEGPSKTKVIADRNGPFNKTDVVDPILPMRRFVIGAQTLDVRFAADTTAGGVEDRERGTDCLSSVVFES